MFSKKTFHAVPQGLNSHGSFQLSPSLTKVETGGEKGCLPFTSVHSFDSYQWAWALGWLLEHSSWRRQAWPLLSQSWASPQEESDRTLHRRVRWAVLQGTVPTERRGGTTDPACVGKCGDSFPGKAQRTNRNWVKREWEYFRRRQTTHRVKRPEGTRTFLRTLAQIQYIRRFLIHIYTGG